MIVCPAPKRSREAQTYLDQLCQVDASMTQADVLSQAFLAMVRERRGCDLEAWITAATDSGLEALARFARGLQGDLVAIKAGLTLEWSNGVTEGQIHRLKLVKPRLWAGGLCMATTARPARRLGMEVGAQGLGGHGRMRVRGSRPWLGDSAMQAHSHARPVAHEPQLVRHLD